MPTPDFPRVIAAETVSNFGTMLSRLVIPWLAVIQLQFTPLQMAWLGIAEVAAAGLGALWLGVWVDRRGKRAVMLLCDALRCALLLGLALCIWRGWGSMGLLLLASAAAGVLTLGFELARSAWIAQRVQADELPARNAQLAMVASLSETAAFALGGWLYQALGAVLALVIDALSYAGSALCLRGVREAPAAALPAEPGSLHKGAAAGAAAMWIYMWREAGSGLRVVAAVPALRSLAAMQLLLAVAMGSFGTVVMIFITRDLAVPPGQQGLIYACGALGAIAGAALAPLLGRRLRPGRALALGLAVFALGLACVPLAAPAGAALGAWAALLLLVAQQVVGDAGHTLQDVHDRSLRQSLAPPELLARADAGIRSLTHAGTLTGMLTAGLLGEGWGVGSVLWLAVALAAAAALLAWLRLGSRRGI